MATAVRPEQILKDLAHLWVDLGKENHEPESAGVLRACAMTLIVGAEDEADCPVVSETVAALMHEHPSRAIVVRLNRDEERHLSARVFAQCWMPFGRRQQICCEEIEITAAETSLPDAVNVIRAITAPDLPIVVWSRCPSLSMSPDFAALFPIAGKIIFDSARFPDPKAGRAFIAKLTKAGWNAADLSWTRLTRWREAIAQIFENRNNLAHLSQIDKVTIKYAEPAAQGGRPVPVEYLADWFRHMLPRGVQVCFEAMPGEERRIRAVSLDGPGFKASVTLVEDDSGAVVVVNDVSRHTAFPPVTDYYLMQEELSLLGTDTIFRRCVA